MRASIGLKRAYEEPEAADGRRFLVDRLWPRGRSREALELAGWLRDAAPSDELRRRYHARPELWEEFCRSYRAELEERPESWRPLLVAAGEGPITLVYAARDTEHNNAVALRSFLLERLEGDGDR
jgi:uncharacterized protein YeaO (DUF488 family)